MHCKENGTKMKANERKTKGKGTEMKANEKQQVKNCNFFTDLEVGDSETSGL